MNTEAIYDVLNHGTAADCQNLARTLPPSPFKELVVPMLDSERPGARVVAFGPVVIGYCGGSAPEAGAALALALHRYAIELFRSTSDHGLLPTTLSGLADSFVRASNFLGRSEEVVKFADEWIPFYERLGETANLPSLKLGRIDALLNLNRVDDAAKALADSSLPGNPATDIELRRLRRRVEELTVSITKDRSSADSTIGSVDDDFVRSAQAALRQFSSGLPDESRVNDLIDKIGDARRTDPNDPAGFASLLDVLRMGEAVLRRGGAGDSALTVAGRIREATAIFKLQARPSPERIRQSLAELGECLTWAEANGVIELANDALYGVYLCQSRLDDPSAAADALLLLRRNLEETRRRIRNVVERGGAFSRYPHLFSALCEKLYDAGRTAEMLEAIEANKGRGVADLLTARSDDAVPDATIYTAVARLPELCRQHHFHYVTYLVDEDRTYAGLVTSDGEIHAAPPIQLSRAAIRNEASGITAESAEENAERLSPLVAWLERFLDEGAIAPDDHLCVAADDDLANVPFGLLQVNGGHLAETLSTSRIHNAYHLGHLLTSAPARPRKYLGVIVPARKDVDNSKWPTIRAKLREPIEFLAACVASGETIEGASASPEAICARNLRGQIIHFSTHGAFPKQKTPFEHSGLLLGDGHSLPEGRAGEIEKMLTPRKVLDAKVDLTGSHVSMMACVSGLSREGMGGDALGLEWAMIQGGAASVLSTHWNVYAGRAATFLRTFYKEWLDERRSRAAALRATIAALQEAGGHAGKVASWAAFSLTGDWR